MTEYLSNQPATPMKYLFGPVNSRRLGLSLGIDLLPAKTCNFNCIYCEVGPTTKFTGQRREYIPTTEILAEFDTFISEQRNRPDFDVVTITAAGEPTLHTGIGKIIRHIKILTKKPVAVLTNGSLFHVKAVRQALLAADIVIPSLDAALPKSFRKINRPTKSTDLGKIIAGLRQFRNEFSGKIWLEILLVKDINDSPEDIAALNKAVIEIQPDRIQLNTVARPPCESFAIPLSSAEITSVAGQFSGPVEFIADFSRCQSTSHPQAIGMAEIVNLLKRRPSTISDLCAALAIDHNVIKNNLTELEKQRLVSRTIHNDKEDYQTES